MELFKLYGNILIKNEEATQSLHSTQKDAIEVANKFEKMAESGTSSGSKLNGAFKGIQNVLSTFGVNLSAMPSSGERGQLLASLPLQKSAKNCMN